MARTTRKSVLGTWVGFVVILVWCLLPVAWILSTGWRVKP